MLTGVGDDVSKFFGFRARSRVLKPKVGTESESEKCDSAVSLPPAQDRVRILSCG